MSCIFSAIVATGGRGGGAVRRVVSGRLGTLAGVIRLHSTATGDLIPLEPVRDGEGGIYVCGATVQGAPHIGHMRSAVVFGQLRRWRTGRGRRGTLGRDTTGIGHKVTTHSRA